VSRQKFSHLAIIKRVKAIGIELKIIQRTKQEEEIYDVMSNQTFARI
jgi:hypothetical protein